jgi:hypothetical protein
VSKEQISVGQKLSGIAQTLLGNVPQLEGVKAAGRRRYFKVGWAEG